MHFVDAKCILSPKNGMNLYRGCIHGCIYCDSRSDCYRMDHDFEDIEVKRNAIELLDDALRRKHKRCMIGMGSMTDPYIPLESDLRHTRKALEVIERRGFGATLITKSSLVERDIDILKRINENARCVIQMTLTTYDDDLCRTIEPNVSTTGERLRTLRMLRDAGIPTVVWLCPILPFINDTEDNISGIVEGCTEAGVKGIICFGMGVTLRSGDREYFYSKLDESFPGMKDIYIRTYGDSYTVNSPDNVSLMRLFHDLCENNGMMHDNDRIFEYINDFGEKSRYVQSKLFD